MAVTYLNTSTLSEALDAGTGEFTVGSTANISVGNLLVIRDEAVKVVEIPVSGRVKVTRGVNGTLSRAHASGQRFFIGSPEVFKTIKDHANALVGNSGNLPDYLLPGQRARDGQGNEYIMVDLDATGTVYGGTTVGISNDGLFTASPLHGGTHQGSVGVLIEPGTSDQYVWAQIYGYNSYATVKTTAIPTSAYICTATTTVSTPDVGLAPISAATTESMYVIHGMFIVGTATSQTSATSTPGQYVPVYLNYPFIYNRLQSEETSNS